MVTKKGSDLVFYAPKKRTGPVGVVFDRTGVRSHGRSSGSARSGVRPSLVGCTLAGMSGPRPERRAKAEAAAGPGLFDLADAVVTGPAGTGRHAQATDRAVKAAYADGTLDPTSEAVVTVLRSLAWSLDEAEHRHMPYAPAKTATAALDLLREMHMTPHSRADLASEADELADMFALLSAPGQVIGGGDE